MYSLQFIFLITILPNVLPQTQDPYLCKGEVQVSYTITEQTPMEEYGRFAEAFRRIGIKASTRSVKKTKLVSRLVCCPGYEPIKEDSQRCQPVTTTENPRRLHESETTSNILCLPWIIAFLCSSLTLIIIVGVVAFYHKKRGFFNRVDKLHENCNELEARTALFGET